MRKFTILMIVAVILTLLVSFDLQAQKGRYFPWTGETLKVKSTATTTSTVWHKNYAYMAFTVMCADSATGDSTDAKLYVDYCTTPGTDWAVADTIDVTAESTYLQVYYHPTNHPMLPFVRFRIKGHTANSKLKYSVTTIKGTGFEE